MSYWSTLPVLILFSLLIPQKEKSSCKNGSYILQQSISLHDPSGQWDETVLSLRVQEPRLQDPSRFSNVKLDNKSKVFRLERSRDAHVSTHTIDEQGVSKTLLDGKEVQDKALIEKYLLQTERNTKRRGYYNLMYGVPMILDNTDVKMGEVAESEIDGNRAIEITFEFENPVFTDKMKVYFSPDEYKVLGLETINEDGSDGEVIVFNGTADFDGLHIARFRHWYAKKDMEFLGSDILVDPKHKE